MEIIYADSLFLLNAIVDYLLLLSAGKICALPLRRWRMALGAVWGGAYALLAVLLPQIFTLVTVKLFAGAAAVLIAFGFDRRSPRAVIVFFAVSAAFGGAVYAAAGLAGDRWDGGVRIPVSLRVLALSFAVCYAAVSLVFRHIGRRAERRLHTVEISLNGKSAAFSALEDSGNELIDPITGDGVLVVQAETLAPLFEVPAALFERDAPAALETLCAAGAGGGFRLLPCACVAAEAALLLCFRPDTVRVGGRLRRDLLIAVSPNRLAPDGEYQAVI